MANRDTSIDPRLLESAKKHFKENGFLGAQLQDICRDAGITTGALYKRYKGKEELFEAVVSGTVAYMNDILSGTEMMDPKALSDRDLLMPWFETEETHKLWFERLLSIGEGFELLLTCSEGTKYSNFHHDWVERMTEMDYLFLKEAQDRGLADPSITKMELHVLVSAMWELYYEPLIHNMSDEEIRHHCKVASDVFNWPKALGMKLPQM